MRYVNLRGAYGRVYKNKSVAAKDWQEGKDFLNEDTAQYCSIRDFPRSKILTIMIRTIKSFADVSKLDPVESKKNDGFLLTVEQYFTKIKNRDKHLEKLVADSVCPALCSAKCEVEPDGHCIHGHPSLLLELGLI